MGILLLELGQGSEGKQRVTPGAWVWEQEIVWTDTAVMRPTLEAKTESRLWPLSFFFAAIPPSELPMQRPQIAP